MESIAAKGPEATIAKGQTLAHKDVTVTATLTNGKTRVLEPSEYTLEGFDTTKLGEQTVTVRLVADSSVTATFTVDCGKQPCPVVLLVRCGLEV